MPDGPDATTPSGVQEHAPGAATEPVAAQPVQEDVQASEAADHATDNVLAADQPRADEPDRPAMGGLEHDLDQLEQGEAQVQKNRDVRRAVEHTDRLSASERAQVGPPLPR